MTHLRRIVPAAIAVALALGACGSSSSDDAAAPPTTAPPAATSAPATAATTAAAATTADPADSEPNPIDAVAEDLSASYAVTPWSDRPFEATDMRFLPDGRALVITKGGWNGPGTGKVELLDADGRFVRDLLDVPDCVDAERGLVGLEVDPKFAENGWIYVFYTRQMSSCAITWKYVPRGQEEPNPVWNRISRFTLTDAGIDPASEQVVLDELPGHNGAHNGGGLSFMADGSLVVGVGEAAFGLSRDLDHPTGKVLRLRPGANGAEVPSDNPYAGATSSETKPLVYASGLRNPFRVAANPETGEIAAADVGELDWEEVDVVEPGGDYGWPDAEGDERVGGSLRPTFAYAHKAHCNSVIGGAWMPASFVAGAERSVYVFSDLGCPGLWALEPGTDGPRVVKLADTMPSSPAAIVAGPDGAVYAVAIGPGPQPVLRIAPTG